MMYVLFYQMLLSLFVQILYLIYNKNKVENTCYKYLLFT